MKAHHDPEPSDVFATAWDVFRRVVENCPVGIFTADVSGRHVFVNRHWTVLTGVPRDKAVGRGWERAVHPEDVRAVTRRWRQLVTEGDELTIQIRLLRPDGSARPAILRAAAVVGENGHRRFAGTLSALSDPGPDSRPSTGALDGTSAPGAAHVTYQDAGLAAAGTDATGAHVAGSDAAGSDADAAAGPPTGNAINEVDDTAGVMVHAEPESGGTAPAGGDGRDTTCPNTIELLREELDRFDMVTDDLWFPPSDDVDHPGQSWTVPSPRQPSSAEVDPPSVDPADPRRPDGPGRPFADTPFTDMPFRDMPFRDMPFAGPPRGQARAWLPGRTPHGPGAADGRDAGRHTDAGEDSHLPPVPRSGAGAHRGALPPGAEWRAAVSAHSTVSGPHPFIPRNSSTGRNSASGSRSTDPFASQPGRGSADARPGHGADDSGCGCAFTEIRRLADACHERERWLTTLLAELPSAVLVADVDARVVAVNQAYCDLFDLSEAPVDLIGTDCRAHIRPMPGLVEDPAGFAHRLDTLLRRRRTLRREAVMFADGRVFERSHIPLAGPEGYHGHVWLYVDVTDRRIVEAEIEGLISGL
ncbi:histidine kinase [Parafrankia colletiae]|uniref:Histidine kinase n=1 Tax=Parafrankia colletiae TaxID=573497 RepID=A0A1S1RG75_9ACTN|nr:PAS domain-containing protein [Parafrankia colletiae]MCK9904820.1 PAS domain-containing protein [Frankia sp. Cpl3]OHV45200.1 histidine kinase [Parafrankia colletiae]